MLTISEASNARLINGIGLTAASIEDQARLLQRVYRLIGEGLASRVWTRLSDTQQTELDALMTACTDAAQAPTAFWTFARTALPDLPEMLDEEIDRLIAQYDKVRLARPHAPPVLSMDPLALSSEEELKEVIVETGTDIAMQVGTKLDLTTPDLMGADTLLMDLAVGPSRFLSAREKKRWIARTATQWTVGANILIWLTGLAIVIGDRFTLDTHGVSIPGWLLHLLPISLSGYSFGEKLVSLVCLASLTSYVIIKAGVLLEWRYHGPVAPPDRPR